MIRPTSIVLTLSLLLTSQICGAAEPLELKPNLRVLPATDVHLEVDFVGRTMLRFTTVTWNSGDGPLEVVAGETGQDRKGNNRQNVYQVVYLDDGTSYRRLAGTFIWHPGHNHFHIQDYADYMLQPAGAKGKSKLTSSKTSFCLMDTQVVDGTLPNSPASAFYSGCGDQVQGISVGWGDVYGEFLVGQEIDVSGVADGDYELSFQVDPKNRLLETDDNDNDSCVLVHIQTSALLADVLPSGCGGGTGSPPPGDASIASITPNTLQKGTFRAVTILGSGFAAGMAVKFENGSGPSPVVSDVTYADGGDRIDAIVTAKNGGNDSDPVWDLRVGNATLSDALTITP